MRIPLTVQEAAKMLKREKKQFGFVSNSMIRVYRDQNVALLGQPQEYEIKINRDTDLSSLTAIEGVFIDYFGSWDK